MGRLRPTLLLGYSNYGVEAIQAVPRGTCRKRVWVANFHVRCILLPLRVDKGRRVQARNHNRGKQLLLLCSSHMLGFCLPLHEQQPNSPWAGLDGHNEPTLQRTERARERALSADNQCRIIREDFPKELTMAATIRSNSYLEELHCNHELSCPSKQLCPVMLGITDVPSRLRISDCQVTSW